MGLALAVSETGTFLYVTDAGSDAIRVIGPDGVVRTVPAAPPLLTPTRIAYHPAGWLYVTSGAPAGVTAVPAVQQLTVAGLARARRASGE
jgi:DNA-binding beta-propeller fold protein YncE